MSIEKEAEAFVSEKADKGNFDVEKFGKAYFSESSMKQALVKFAELRERNLKKKISVLLSCKKCPENKGGYICKEEYDNKCLAQKIQHIKELKEENAELKADNDARKFAMVMSEKVEKQLREQIEKMKCCYNCSKWNDGQCENIKDGYFFHCADFGCDKWELED